MLKLYTVPGTCALASHIALEEAGAPYSVEVLSFKNNQQSSAEYLKINPKGRVPALLTDHGVLTETPAILTSRPPAPISPKSIEISPQVPALHPARSRQLIVSVYFEGRLQQRAA